MPTTYTIPSGLSMRQKKALAALLACAPCCGSGSGGGIRMPNGCAGCNCCPCVCWWATQWHKLITKDNLLIGPALSPDWTLVSNGLVQIGGDPDYMYLGDVASDATSCTIGGLSAIDSNGDIISDISNAAYPKWEGDIVYTNGLIEITLNFTIHLLMTISWSDCTTQTISDSFVWSGSTLNSGAIPPGETADYYPVINDILGGNGSLADCGGTFPIGFGGNLVNLPDFQLIPLLDPECVA